jgi:alpha/beta superfamily hydrolase
VTLAEPGCVRGPEAAPGEHRLFFQGDGRLEGMLGWPERDDIGEAGDSGATAGSALGATVNGGVVICHPYPPNGANMDLPVVHGMAKCCRQRQFVSLRFNFRSVGASEGSFSGTEEDRDVAAAVSHVSAELRPVGGPEVRLPLGLAGWSFGSVMAARAAAGLPEVKALALIGFVPNWEHLPADTYERLAGYHGPVLAVCAENDHHGTPDEVEKVLAGLGLRPHIQVVPGADHYLMGRHREVAELVADFFAEALVV